MAEKTKRRTPSPRLADAYMGWEPPLPAETPSAANVPADELTEAQYGILAEALRKIYDGLDTPEHHLAYVRERLAAARAEP